MARCKHRNGQIVEAVSAYSVWPVENGNINRYMSSSDNDGPTGKYDFLCFDCGFRKAYVRGKAPKWIEALLKQVWDGPYDYHIDPSKQGQEGEG